MKGAKLVRIGLELHAQLATPTKLFSATAAPDTKNVACNSHVAPFDSAIPGTLPRLNRTCVEKAIMAAILLNCEVAEFCRFDRKHYFYPDLPLGYQITQKWNPIAKDGYLDFYAQPDDSFPSSIPSQEVYEKRVRIEQIQLEMDSGKTIRNGANDLLDLNRAGMALIEIVTAPDLNSPTEVACFVEHMRMLLGRNGVCTGHNNEGNLRVDANISVSGEDGRPGAKTELKNISSTGHLMEAVEKELARQIAVLAAGGLVQEETRAVNSKGGTVSARAKGAQFDYRFIPEPNLPPLSIEPSWLEVARSRARLDLPHLEFIRRHGFTPLFAFEVVRDKELSKFMDAFLANDRPLPFAQLSLWLAELRFLSEKLRLPYPLSDERLIGVFSELVHLACQGRLTKQVCLDLFREVVSEGKGEDGLLPRQSIAERVERAQLWRICDPAELDRLVDSAIAEQPGDFVDRLLAGKIRPLAKLKRTVMAVKRASAEDVDAAIARKMQQLTSRNGGGRRKEGEESDTLER